MADVNATFNYDADFTSAISQTRLLSRELSVLNNSFNSLDKDARKVRDRLGEIFKADVGDLGAFSARTVDITSNMDNFGKALDRNKLKLRDYAREARKAFQADSNSRKLAEDQVRRSKANLVEMGMDASGRRKGVLVTPLRLDMSDMQNQLDVARKQFSIFNRLVNDGATQLINWGKNTQWAGRQLTVGLTVPMTIFATTTIKAFNEVDKELTRFQKVYGSDLVGATTQATNAIRQQVQALAVDIAGSYGIAAKETAGLAADLAATGLEGQKLLDSIKQTTRLSVLGEIDRQDAMKTTLSLQNAFNMSTQELAESINFLNAVENQTSLSLQDLTEAIPKVGPVVRALGGDVKDLSVLMVAMKEGGINAAEGANALKSGLASLINPTKAGSEVAKQYGIDLEDIVKRNKGQLLPTVLEFQKSMQTLDDLGKAKIIEQLFGKYQFARISALFDNLNTQGSQTKQVIELMSASNSDLARIANEEIKTLTESASMRFQRSMEAIKAALLPVGEAIVNSVLPFMEKFAGVLDRIVSFAQNLPGPIKSFLKVVAGLTSVAGPIIMMAGVLGNFAGYIIKGSMAFVNLGRVIRGLPVEKFSLMDDSQIAAAKATDTVTISIEKQKSAMIGLNKLMMDYYTLINKQAARTPNLFNSTPQSSTIGGSPVVPKGVKTLPIIKRQSGGAAWVPGNGSGDKIPALLEPGEFVINRNAAKQYGGVLEDINNGVPRFAKGGKMPRKIPVPGYMSGFTGARMAAYNARYFAPARQPERQAAQQPNPGGQPLRYGNEAEWERNLPSPINPDGIAYGPITHRRQFQARQADEQVSVITSALQNATRSENFLSAIPELVRNIQIRTGIKIREIEEGKPFPAASTFPMPRPLNTAYNDLLPGVNSNPSVFTSILEKIAQSPTLTLEQKKSLFKLVSNGDAPADPQIISFMSRSFGEILDAGLPDKFSKELAAKMALAATAPNYFVRAARPMSAELGDITANSKNRSISGIPKNKIWTDASAKLGLEFLPKASQESAAQAASTLLASSLGISNKEARKLIDKQKVGEFHVSHAQSGGIIKAQRGITGPKPFSGVPTVKVNPFKLIGMGGVNEDNPIAGLDKKSGMFYKQIKNNRGFNKDAMISEAVFSQIYKSGLFGENVTGIDQRLFNADTGNGTMPVLGSKFIQSLKTGEDLYDSKSAQFNRPTPFAKGVVNKKAIEAMLASKILGNYDTHTGNFGISNGKFVMLDNTSNLLTDANGLQRRTSQALNDFSYSPDRDALDRLGTQAYRKNSGSEKATIKYLDGILAKLNDGQSYVSQAIMRATQGSPELLKSMNDYAFKKSRGSSKTYEELVTSMIALRVEKMKSNLYVDEDNLTLADGGPRLALQSGGIIRAQRGIKMPESYATKLATIRQSMANANKEAMSSNVPLTELGTRQSRIGGYSSAIPGVNGVYEINGQRYVVKGHDTYESAKAEADMARITRDVFGLQTPNQEAVRIRHPETGELMFAVRSPYNEAFAKTTARFTEDSAFDQLIASVARRDKDLQADNLFDNIVTDVGQAGIMSKASQPRIKTGPTNSALEQLAINLGMTKGGARSHGAEAWNAATANMTDDQIISRIKEAAAKAKSKLSTADIPEDFKYIARDLDDIASADLGPFVAHLRTVFPKEKKPATAAALAKKEQQKLLDREERQSALDAGYPAWAMQSGGLLRAQDGAWVPGKGEGDRVPALLEPGEFVVNKKAAMKYGGMLEDMNWNVAPRFMRGTPPMGQMPGMTTGAVSGGLMAASMASSMMLPVNQFTDALNKSIMALSAFTGILSAMQMLGGRMGGGIGEKLSGVMTPKPGSKGAGLIDSATSFMDIGKKKMAGTKTAASRGYAASQLAGDNKAKSLAKGATRGASRLGSGVSSIGKGMALRGAGAAVGLLSNPVGWAILAVTAVTTAVLSYKKALDSVKKSAEQAFGASKAEAEAFGVELKSIGETIKANQEYTKRIGAQAQQSQSTSQRLDPEKEAAVLDANKDLTKRLRNLSETRLGTTVGLGGDRSAQGASLLTAKYASLLQQGFSEEDANVMVRTLAKASGAMDAYAQSVNKFGMIKADDPSSIVKAQMEGLKTYEGFRERGGFAEGMKSVVESINMLPPEDQYTGLKTLLTQIENLDTTKLKIAQQSLIDMTKQNYGEGSQLFNTQRAIQERTNDSFSFKNLSTYDDVFAKIRGGQGIFGGFDNEQATKVTAALTSAFETGAITDQQLKDYELRIEADPSSIDEIERELDTVTRDRQMKIEMDIKIREQLAEDYEKINKEIIVKQNQLQDAIESKNAAIEKEEEKFKNSQKAGQKYIKAKQEEIKILDEQATKEIEAIEKQTDTYLKSLTKQDDANKFRAEQRGTMLGGLGALAEGDVFGFLDARQAAEENARQFSSSEEIKAIEEKKNAAVEAIDLERDKRIEAIQEEIDKRQEALEKQAEGHEAHMARLAKERDTMARNASKTISEMQATSDAIAGIQGNDTVIGWLGTLRTDAERAAEKAALINYLIKHPEATVAEALKVVRKDLYQRDQSYGAGQNAGGGERAGGATPDTSSLPRDPVTRNANGGYISGPGTGTSDSIPARLSDGEYVIKASAVDQYGVGMMNSINEQRFANGGQVLDDYSRVTYGGKTFNARTVRMLKRAEESYGSGFGFYQGSYSTGVSASKGTHDGGGAVDIKPPANIDKALKALASAGFWAKWRGSMNPPHIHALATGDAQLSSAARRQLGLPADGGYEGDQVEVGTRTLEDAIKEVSEAGQGTIKELTDIMTKGAAAVYTPFTGRQFGGSMTMNKPYLVGENGPEVVMPYGSGSRVDPRFNVPSGSSIATVSQNYSDIISSNSYSNMVVNLSVSGVNDPNKAADRVIEILNKETGRRNHSRRMGK
jgi:TP901 family phage tail tape measure protein